MEADDIDDNEDDEDTGDHVYPPYQETIKEKQTRQVIVNKTNRNRSQIESRRRLDQVASLVLKATTNSRNAGGIHSSGKPDSPKLMKGITTSRRSFLNQRKSQISTTTTGNGAVNSSHLNQSSSTVRKIS